MIRSSNEENEDKNANGKTDSIVELRDHDLNQIGKCQMKGGQIRQDDRQQHLSEQNNLNKSKRNPFCSRCRNHGKSAQVKGHKRHCEYRECQCYGCKLVEQRQHISAQQIKMRRNQRQDEEYGRRIEVSPPVLTRVADTDPDLMHSLRHVNVSSPVLQKAPLISVVASKADICHKEPAVVPGPTCQIYSHLQDHHLNAMPASTIDQFDKISNLSTHTNNHQTTAHQQHLNQQHLGLKFNPSYTDSHRQQDIMNASVASSASVSHLGGAFQILQFPNSVLSTNDSIPNQTTPVARVTATSVPSTAVLSTADGSGFKSAVPSASEQLGLVDEIYHAFGPLAIYAWLRAEKFDRQKIRHLVESSRPLYNNLMDSRSIQKYRLDNRDLLTSSSSDSNGRSSSTTINSEGNHQPQKQSRPPSREESQRNRQDESASQQAHVSMSSSFHLRTPFSLNSPLLSSPVHTIGGSTNYLNHEISNLANQPAMHRHSLSSASLSQSISSALAAQSHNILWPGLKLASGGISPTSLIPHHLMPHFMQQHSFLAQQAQQRQISLNSMVNGTNSSSGSSSSALL